MEVRSNPSRPQFTRHDYNTLQGMTTPLPIALTLPASAFAFSMTLEKSRPLTLRAFVLALPDILPLKVIAQSQ